MESTPPPPPPPHCPRDKIKTAHSSPIIIMVISATICGWYLLESFFLLQKLQLTLSHPISQHLQLTNQISPTQDPAQDTIDTVYHLHLTFLGGLHFVYLVRQCQSTKLKPAKYTVQRERALHNNHEK